MSSPETGPPKLLTVGAVSLAIGVVLGLLAQTNFTSREKSAPVRVNSRLDPAIAAKHCRDVLEKIERSGARDGNISAGFASRYQSLCDESARSRNAN